MGDCYYLSLPSCVAKRLLLFCDPLDLTSFALANKQTYADAKWVANMVLNHLRTEKNGSTVLKELYEQCSPLQVLEYVTRRRSFLIGGGNILDGRDSYLQANSFDFSMKKWVSLPPMKFPHGSIKTEVVHSSDHVFVIGSDDHESMDSVESYSVFSKEWTVVANLPEKLRYQSSAMVGEVLYVSGGLNGETMLLNPQMYHYDAPTNTWCTHPQSICNPRFGHMSIGIDSRYVMLINGKTEQEYTNTAELYDLSNPNLPPKITTLQHRRMWGHVVTIEEYIYVIGGNVDHCGNGLFPTIERYHPVTQSWEHVADFPRMRRLFAVTTVGECIVVSGGKDEVFANLVTSDVFDTTSKSWYRTNAKSIGTSDNSSLVLIDQLGTLPREKFCGGQMITLGNRVTWNDVF